MKKIFLALGLLCSVNVFFAKDLDFNKEKFVEEQFNLLVENAKKYGYESNKAFTIGQHLLCASAEKQMVALLKQVPEEEFVDQAATNKIAGKLRKEIQQAVGEAYERFIVQQKNQKN